MFVHDHGVKPLVVTPVRVRGFRVPNFLLVVWQRRLHFQKIINHKYLLISHAKQQLNKQGVGFFCNE